MRAGKFRIIFTIAFALALVAGAAAGVLATRFAAAPTPPPPSPTAAGVPSLDDLDLTSDQREQVRHIWEGIKEKSDQSYRQAQKIQQERDDKVFELLTKAQQEQFKQIYGSYAEQNTKLKAERDQTVKKAIEETKSLLSSPQRQKYDAILKSRLGGSAEPGQGSGLPQYMPTLPATRSSGREI